MAYSKQIDNQIRRINRYLERAFNEFGAGSEFVERQKTTAFIELRRGRTANEAFNMKDGRMVVSRSTKNNPVPFTKAELDRLEEKLKTMSIADERQKIYDKFKEEFGKAPTKGEIKRYAPMINGEIRGIADAIAFLYSVEGEEADATPLLHKVREKGKKKTYAEWEEIIEEAEEIRRKRYEKKLEDTNQSTATPESPRGKKAKTTKTKADMKENPFKPVKKPVSWDKK